LENRHHDIFQPLRTPAWPTTDARSAAPGGHAGKARAATPARLEDAQDVPGEQDLGRLHDLALEELDEGLDGRLAPQKRGSVPNGALQRADGGARGQLKIDEQL